MFPKRRRLNGAPDPRGDGSAATAVFKNPWLLADIVEFSGNAEAILTTKSSLLTSQPLLTRLRRNVYDPVIAPTADRLLASATNEKYYDVSVNGEKIATINHRPRDSSISIEWVRSTQGFRMESTLVVHRDWIRYNHEGAYLREMLSYDKVLDPATGNYIDSVRGMSGHVPLPPGLSISNVYDRLSTDISKTFSRLLISRKVPSGYEMALGLQNAMKE